MICVSRRLDTRQHDGCVKDFCADDDGALFLPAAAYVELGCSDRLVPGVRAFYEKRL